MTIYSHFKQSVCLGLFLSFMAFQAACHAQNNPPSEQQSTPPNTGNPAKDETYKPPLNGKDKAPAQTGNGQNGHAQNSHEQEHAQDKASTDKQNTQPGSGGNQAKDETHKKEEAYKPGAIGKDKTPSQSSTPQNNDNSDDAADERHYQDQRQYPDEQRYQDERKYQGEQQYRDHRDGYYAPYPPEYYERRGDPYGRGGYWRYEGSPMPPPPYNDPHAVPPPPPPPPAARIPPEFYNMPPQQAATEACFEDVRRLCGGVMPGRGRVIECLFAQRGRDLSPLCRTTLEAVREVMGF